MERFKHYTLVILTGITGSILVFSFIAAIVLNSGILNHYAQQKLVELFNRELSGQLELKRVYLNFPNKVVLIGPKIYEPGSNTPALSAKKISARFNFLMLLQPEITRLSFRNIDADNLQADFIEHKNGKYNIEIIFTPRKPDSTKAPFESFSCRKLSLQNAAFSLKRKQTGNTPQAYYQVKRINLLISALRIKENLFNGVIKKSSFMVPSHAFRLREGSGKFHISTTRSELLSVKARSEKSSGKFSISLDDFNIFKSGNARQILNRITASRSFVSITKLNLHTGEIKKFYPVSELPDGLYQVKGNARVNDGLLEILDSRITRGKSKITLKGTARNLQKRARLAFTVTCDTSSIEPEILKFLLRNTPYRDLATGLGTIKFFGKARGSSRQITTSLGISTDAGSLSLKAEAKGDIDRQLTWNGAFTIRDLETYRLAMEAAGRNNRQNRLQADGRFSGRSRGLKSLDQLDLAANVRDSFWKQQEIKNGSISAQYMQKRLNATLNLYNGTELLEATGEIDWNPVMARYQVNGRVKRINLAKALGTKKFSTNLNGTLAIKGEGFDTRSLNTAAVFRFEPSSVNKFRFRDRSEAALAIAQRKEVLQVQLKSDFLDASISGNQSLKQLISALELTGYGISRELANRSLRKSGTATTAGPSSTQPEKPFRSSYQITVRDVAPLALFLPVGDLALQGTANGELLYENGLSTLSSSITVTSFSDTSGTSLQNLAADAVVTCNRKGMPKAALKGTTAKLLVAGVTSEALVFNAAYQQARVALSLDGKLPERNWQLQTTLSAQQSGALWNLTVNTFSLGNGLNRWTIPDGSRIAIGRASVLFDNLRIAKNRQQIVLDGRLSSSEAGTFRCSLSNVDLDELNRKRSKKAEPKFAGILNGTLTVSGPSGLKTSVLDLTGTSIRYEQIIFGGIRCTARHKGGQMKFDFRSSSAQSMENKMPVAINAIQGSGSIPLALQYVPLKVSIPDAQSINASFRSDNLSAKVVTYVLPLFEKAEGIIPTTMTISGRTPKPEIHLTSRLQNTMLTLESTKTSYRMNGEVVASPRQVELKDIRIRDTRNGTGRLNGTIRLTDLEPKEINLGASCSSLLLFDKKELKDDTSFGTITGTTRNIRMHGNISAPVVEGEMIINNADLSMYRAGANESTKYVGVEKFIEFVPRRPVLREETATKEGHVNKPTEFHYSLIDILQIRNLKLVSTEPIKYTVIFDRVRGEELETVINNLYLIVNKSNQRYRLYGSVNVADGKYRFSNTNFDLEDGGKITWNNAEIRDGQMDNLYGSKYMSISNAQTGERDNVKMLLAITGTLNEPHVILGYYLNEQAQPYASKSMIGSIPSQIDPNAEINVISMLFSKQWYAPPGTAGRIGDLAVSSAGLATGAGLVSSQISQVIQNIAGLESFNINLGVDKEGQLSGIDLYFAVNIPGTNGRLRFVGTGSSPDIKDKALFNYYGTSQKIEYRVTPKVYIEAYRSYGQPEGSSATSNLQKPSEHWGASVSYRERFHTWDQFWKRIAPSSEKKTPEAADEKKQTTN